MMRITIGRISMALGLLAAAAIVGWAVMPGTDTDRDCGCDQGAVRRQC